jgi:hypothetical protein
MASRELAIATGCPGIIGVFSHFGRLTRAMRSNWMCSSLDRLIERQRLAKVFRRVNVIMPLRDLQSATNFGMVLQQLRNPT